MRNNNRFDAIASHFDALVAKYGYHHCGCDYGRIESQQTRFSILSQATNYNGKSVLDVGCGFADFADYLKAHFKGCVYSGVDISREMVRLAKARHPDLDIRILNVLTEDPGRFDIVTANGIFYLLGPEAKSIMQAIVRRLFDIANETVVFSSLSVRAPRKEPAEFYADPAEVFNFCQTITERVTLRHDYLPHDFTIYMYKSN